MHSLFGAVALMFCQLACPMEFASHITTHRSMNTPIEKWLTRALKVWPIHRADLDMMMLAERGMEEWNDRRGSLTDLEQVQSIFKKKRKLSIEDLKQVQSILKHSKEEPNKLEEGRVPVEKQRLEEAERQSQNEEEAERSRTQEEGIQKEQQPLEEKRVQEEKMMVEKQHIEEAERIQMEEKRTHKENDDLEERRVQEENHRSEETTRGQTNEELIQSETGSNGSMASVLDRKRKSRSGWFQSGFFQFSNSEKEPIEEKAELEKQSVEEAERSQKSEEEKEDQIPTERDALEEKRVQFWKNIKHKAFLEAERSRKEAEERIQKEKETLEDTRVQEENAESKKEFLEEAERSQKEEEEQARQEERAPEDESILEQEEELQAMKQEISQEDKVAALEHQVTKQEEELKVTRSSHDQIPSLTKQVADLKASQPQASGLGKQLQIVRIADLEQQVKKQEEELEATRSSHEQVPLLMKQIVDLEASLQQASGLDQQEKLRSSFRIADLEQKVKMQEEELKVARSSHEQVPSRVRQVVDLKASQQNAPGLKQHKLRIASLRQQLKMQEQELKVIRSSHEQVQLLRKQVADLEASQQPQRFRIFKLEQLLKKQDETLNVTVASHEELPLLEKQVADMGALQRQKLRIADLEQQITRQEEELKVARGSHEQVQLLTKQVLDLEVSQQQASGLEQQHTLRIAELEQQVMKQEEELKVTWNSHEQVPSLTKQVADLEASQQQASDLELQQRLRIADLAERLKKQDEELKVTRSSHKQLSWFEKQVADLEALQQQASQLEQQQRSRIAGLELLLEKQQEELNVTRRSHKQLSWFEKKVEDFEAVQQQASGLEQQQRLKIADVEQLLKKQEDELKLTRLSHEQLPLLSKQVADMEALQQQAFGLEQQHKLRVKELEQHIKKQEEELNVTRSSHEQVPFLKQQVADLETSWQQASGLEQQQRLKIADLEQQLMEQDEEFKVFRISHEQVPLLTQQVADMEALHQQASELEQQHKLRVAELEQHIRQQEEELKDTRSSNEQVPLLTKQIADLEAYWQETSGLEQQQRLKIADLEQRLTEQDEELRVTRSSHEQLPSLAKQVADLEASQQEASGLEEQQRLRNAELEQQVMKQEEELQVTRKSHEQVPLLSKQVEDLEASQQQASNLEQWQRLKISDLEQQVVKQEDELKLTRSSHEHLSRFEKQVADLEALQQQTSALEQQQRLRIANLEQQLMDQEEELKVTRTSHKQVPMLTKQVADMETWQQQASGLQQQQRLRITDLVQQVMKQEDELKVTRSSHEQVPLLTKQVVVLEASQRQAFGLEQQQRLRIVDLEQQLKKQEEELTDARNSHEQIPLLTKQVEDLESWQQQAYGLEQQQRLKIADLEQQVKRQDEELRVTQSLQKQVPWFMKQVAGMEASQRQSSALGKQQRLRIAVLEQQLKKQEEELKFTRSSYRQLSSLTKQVADLEALQHQTSSLDEQQGLRGAGSEQQLKKQEQELKITKSSQGHVPFLEKQIANLKALQEQTSGLQQYKRRIASLKQQLKMQEEELDVIRNSPQRSRIADLEQEAKKQAEESKVSRSSHEQAPLLTNQQEHQRLRIAALVQQIKMQEEELRSPEQQRHRMAGLEQQFDKQEDESFQKFTQSSHEQVPWLTKQPAVSEASQHQGSPARGKEKGKVKNKVVIQAEWPEMEVELDATADNAERWLEQRMEQRKVAQMKAELASTIKSPETKANSQERAADDSEDSSKAPRVEVTKATAIAREAKLKHSPSKRSRWHSAELFTQRTFPGVIWMFAFALLATFISTCVSSRGTIAVLCFRSRRALRYGGEPLLRAYI